MSDSRILVISDQKKKVGLGIHSDRLFFPEHAITVTLPAADDIVRLLR